MKKLIALVLCSVMLIGCSIGKYRGEKHYSKFKDSKYHHCVDNSWMGSGYGINCWDGYRGRYIGSIIDMHEKEIRTSMIERYKETENKILMMNEELKKAQSFLNDIEKTRQEIERNRLEVEKYLNTFRKLDDFDKRININSKDIDILRDIFKKKLGNIKGALE